jgi:hypothetical protein
VPTTRIKKLFLNGITVRIATKKSKLHRDQLTIVVQVVLFIFGQIKVNLEIMLIIAKIVVL